MTLGFFSTMAVPGKSQLQALCLQNKRWLKTILVCRCGNLMPFVIPETFANLLALSASRAKSCSVLLVRKILSLSRFFYIKLWHHDHTNHPWYCQKPPLFCSSLLQNILTSLRIKKWHIFTISVCFPRNRESHRFHALLGRDAYNFRVNFEFWISTRASVLGFSEETSAASLVQSLKACFILSSAVQAIQDLLSPPSGCCIQAGRPYKKFWNWWNCLSFHITNGLFVSKGAVNRVLGKDWLKKKSQDSANGRSLFNRCVRWDGAASAMCLTVPK